MYKETQGSREKTGKTLSLSSGAYNLLKGGNVYN